MHMLCYFLLILLFIEKLQAIYQWMLKTEVEVINRNTKIVWRGSDMGATSPISSKGKFEFTGLNQINEYSSKYKLKNLLVWTKVLLVLGQRICTHEAWKHVNQLTLCKRLISICIVGVLYPFCSIYSNSRASHVGWLAGLDIILKIDSLRMIQANFDWKWSSGFRREDFKEDGHHVMAKAHFELKWISKMDSMYFKENAPSFKMISWIRCIQSLLSNGPSYDIWFKQSMVSQKRLSFILHMFYLGRQIALTG
jgi:hypothetical protein